MPCQLRRGSEARKGLTPTWIRRSSRSSSRVSELVCARVVVVFDPAFPLLACFVLSICSIADNSLCQGTFFLSSFQTTLPVTSQSWKLILHSFFRILRDFLSSLATDLPIRLPAQSLIIHCRGKGTPRRKTKKVHKTSGTDDKKLQTSLKKLNVQPIQAIEEVNMFKEDGNVIHFAAPKGKPKDWPTPRPPPPLQTSPSPITRG